MRSPLSPRSPATLAFTLALPPLAWMLTGINACGDEVELVPMRDGVQLATDVHTAGRNAGPSILVRTPYDKDGIDSYAPVFNELGYNLIGQDMRGFYDSEGEFTLFTDDGWGETQDGYDTLEWMAAQEWSNGDTCMWGASALGITSLLAAGSTPPGLRCVYALVASGDLYHHVGFWGGALREEMVVNWLNGIEQPESLEAIYAHPTYDAFWEPVSIQERYEAVQVPIYSVGGWYDIFSQGNLDIFSGVEANGGPGGKGTQKLLIGPWSHASAGPTVGELTYPDNSVMPAGEDVRWLERWLKGVENGVDTESPVRYYRMGDVDSSSPDWNIWMTAEAWPVASSPTPYYLSIGGSLSLTPPPDISTSSHYTFDPGNPVPTVGGNNLTLLSGPYDQRSVEDRDDVLVFETAPLEAPTAITGRVTATLWVSSSALDTDFTVKLTDVYPDGRSMLVLDGIARMRFREGVDKELLMTPGEVYPIEVDLWSTSIVFNAGHQIRVAVSSSNSPRFHVNPNNGGLLYNGDAAPVVADQTLYLDAERPSQLTLPIVSLN